jgi:putative PIN family toxin of toxin-antitoxin system
MRRIRVVLDTNVVVSAHLNAEGYERYVLDLALAGKLELRASAEIFSEYEGVLRRKKFGISAKQVAASLRLLRNAARTVAGGEKLQVASDPDDNKFLECASAAGAPYLVTGNKRHFPKNWRGTKVVNAREFIELIVPELRR